MKNYIELIQDILKNGVEREDRTGIGSRSVFGRTLRWDLSEGFPAITTRKVSFRIAFEETMFFLRGDTDTKVLEEKRINIWRGNTSREFLDNRGLSHLPEGSIGTGYSHAWRNFGGHLGQSDGVDQIVNLLEGLKTNPTDRRHLVTAWNPQQNSGTPLPPCHIMHMYSVLNGKLNSCFIMRSNDVPFGLPYNIMGYAFLNHLFAKYLDLTPGELVYMGWDVHIYNNQLDMCKEQITRTPVVLPELLIKKDIKSINDMMSLTYEDVELKNYNPHPDIINKPRMAI